ncbi:hypothetical protein [Sulfitobacter delicatus]|uniref:Uncharacterized protein n=1 Tax=Sulfitobacter delicatus TaxID=218672 RepID=A0A1G7LKI7_9RHOB|nr:hypothetical protein [Sulfitobacter delicatus]SDF49530.1 hypothetical protein SAMN04489759_102318 [Sulfitobacter delicatus]
MAQIRAALVLDIVVNDICNTAEDEHPMMNSNKILTVSYGTFSCTLEGFDDSFGTMKAIAEYFRDLASDDRYFGAEPPQPDAEMLARIAQKEVSRRVQAREQEGKIVLSALEDQSAEPAAAEAPAPQATALAPTLAETPEAQDAPAAALEAEIADTAAVVAEEAPVSPPEAAAAEPMAEDEVEVAAAPKAEAPEVEAPEAEATEEELTEAEAFFAESPQPQSEYEDEVQASAAEDILAQDEAPADSIAAKLQRIRAVVAQQDDEDSYDEDEVAEAAAPVLAEAPEAGDAQHDAAIAAARRDIEDALEADDAADTAEAEAEDEDDDLADILSRLERDEPEQIEAEAPREPEAEAPAPRGRVIKVKRADLDAAIASGTLEEVTEQKDAAATSETAAENTNRNSSLSPEDEDDLARELAALEAELNGTASVEEEADVPSIEPAVAETPTVAAEAEPETDEEDDFAAVLAGAVEGSEEETSEEAEALVDTPEAKDEAAQPARRSLPTIDDEASPDMSRLMDETDSKMGEPESATRRDAFAHLRAAVAAKKADEAMGGPGTKPTSTEAYREDLAEVVRPRRPESRSVRTERPASDARPAPLKLVAEQRIDVDQLRPTGPVRPRRVAAVVEQPKDNPDAESFADFAADMGAHKLPELLEAAASYMSFVEGRDQFSRPQLMGKVRSVGLEDFSREDGLRSFGQLLRAGKIEKIKGGRFTVSEDIGFRPDHRAVG